MNKIIISTVSGYENQALRQICLPINIHENLELGLSNTKLQR